MLLSDLLGKEGLARFQDDRWHSYFDRAADFLRRHFPRAVQPVSDEALLRAIRDAATEARQIGLSAERDHLSFLIARVMLGRRFLLNPLYLDLLYTAGWVDDAGRPARSFTFNALFKQIELWDRVRSTDLISARRLAVRFAKLYEPGAPQGVAAIHMTLPACSAAIRPELLAAFENAAVQNARSIALDGADLQVYCCVAVLLGVETHADPFLPGIGKALASHPPASEERRLAFGVALKQILSARLGMENNDAS